MSSPAAEPESEQKMNHELTCWWTESDLKMNHELTCWWTWVWAEDHELTCWWTGGPWKGFRLLGGWHWWHWFPRATDRAPGRSGPDQVSSAFYGAFCGTEPPGAPWYALWSGLLNLSPLLKSFKALKLDPINSGTYFLRYPEERLQGTFKSSQVAYSSPWLSRLNRISLGNPKICIL